MEKLKVIYGIKNALTGLKTNKKRSALTILGIVIGITAIILIMSISHGAKRLIISQVEGLGSNIVMIEPGRDPQGPSDFAEVFTDSLKEREVKALQNSSLVPGVAMISPNLMSIMTLSFQNETTRAQVLGTSESITRILDLKTSKGSFFTKDDVKQKAHAAVIGNEVKKKLFGNAEALGQKFKIKKRVFKVVGVFSSKGQTGIFNIDEMVIVPHTTMKQYLAGFDYYHSIILKAKEGYDINRMVRDAEMTLRELHGIEDPEKDDFHVFTQKDIAERIGIITGILSALLVSVAAISLVVGGIGIMNIMLVSVTERTREIGLRKAIGATDRNILVQFLLESIALTGAGGVIGIVLGAFFSFIAAAVLSRVLKTNWAFTFPISAAFLGISVSAAVGLIFGLYPARQAAKKSPIEALRYE